MNRWSVSRAWWHPKPLTIAELEYNAENMQLYPRSRGDGTHIYSVSYLYRSQMALC